jgi:bacterioferritin (cytochrome b1)
MWSLSSQYIKMKGENGAELALSETYKDVVAHQKLDESGIATRIADSTQEEMRPARELLDRIWTRDFYPKLITINRGNWADKLSVLADLTAMLEEDVEKDGLKSEDLTVMSTKITTGMTGTKVGIYDMEMAHIL